MTTTLHELKWLICNTKVELPTSPTAILNAVDAICLCKDRKLSPIQRNRLRRNIALLFRFIRSNTDVIDKTYPGVLRRDCFMKEIAGALALLQTMYEFFGKVACETKDELLNDKPVRKQTIQSLFEFSKNPLPPKTRQQGVDMLVLINQVCRYIDTVLTKQQLK